MIIEITKIQEKIKLAEEEERKGNFKNAIHCYEEAIKIELSIIKSCSSPFLDFDSIIKFFIFF